MRRKVLGLGFLVGGAESLPWPPQGQQAGGSVQPTPPGALGLPEWCVPDSPCSAEAPFLCTRGSALRGCSDAPWVLDGPSPACEAFCRTRFVGADAPAAQPQAPPEAAAAPAPADNATSAAAQGAGAATGRRRPEKFGIPLAARSARIMFLRRSALRRSPAASAAETLAVRRRRAA